MKKTSKFLLFIIIIFSLSLNILLLYDKINNKSDNKENLKVSNKVIDIDKTTFINLFKEYQISSNFINPNSLAVFEITEIKNVGYFKSNENKRLYYVSEKYSCIEGTGCVSTNFETKTDESFNNYTTVVVAVTPIDKEKAVFEILDYSIEKDPDFQKINPVILK